MTDRPKRDSAARTWPRSVQLAGMIALGFVLAWLNIGNAGSIAIFAITAFLALGRP